MASATTFINLDWYFITKAVFSCIRRLSSKQRRKIHTFFVVFYRKCSARVYKKPLVVPILTAEDCRCYFPQKYNPDTGILVQLFPEPGSHQKYTRPAWLTIQVPKNQDKNRKPHDHSVISNNSTTKSALKPARLVEVCFARLPLCPHLRCRFDFDRMFTASREVFIVSSVLAFNIGVDAVGPSIQTVKLEEALDHSRSECHEAQLALIKCPLYDSTDMSTVINRVLRDYFAEPRLVTVNDVIAVDNKQSNQYSFVGNDKKSPRLLYFKVSGMSPMSPAVISGLTRVYQISNVNSPIPRTMDNLMDDTMVHCLAVGRWTGIDCVERTVNEIVSRCRSHTVVKPFNHSIDLPGTSVASTRILNIFLHGSIGSGKNLIVDIVANRLNHHLFKINCYELLADSVGSVETKFENLFKQAVSFRPVVIHLSHFEVFAKDMNTGEVDVRVVSFFRRLLESNKFESDKLVVLIASSVTAEIDGDLLSLFDQQIEIKSLTAHDRRQALECYIGEITTTMNELPHIAQKIAGFTLADIETLVAEAKQLRSPSYGSLKQQHFEEALGKMKSLEKLGMGAASIPNVKWEDVGGLTEVKRVITDAIQLCLEHPELFSSGLRRSGILLYGPPGCGKTLLAKAVASECSLNFFSVKGPELLNMYVGQSEQNIREVFDRARSVSPCVIFFDELDSLAPNRGRSGDSGGVMDRVVSQLLAELDGVSSASDKSDIFVIGATNRPDLIDSSLLRPGRFDKVLYVGMNDEDADAKLQVLRACCRKLERHPDVNLASIIQQCPPGLTGADYSSLVSGAVMHCMTRLLNCMENDSLDEEFMKIEVQMVDFERSLQELNPSVTPEELNRYKAIQSSLMN